MRCRSKQLGYNNFDLLEHTVELNVDRRVSSGAVISIGGQRRRYNLVVII